MVICMIFSQAILLASEPDKYLVLLFSGNNSGSLVLILLILPVIELDGFCKIQGKAYQICLANYNSMFLRLMH